MAIHKKAQWARLKVGIMAVVAMAIVGVLIFLLTGNENPFAKRDHLSTYMHDSAALAESSPVRLNGILVGKVSKILLTGSNDPKRIVKMDMEVEKKYLPQIPVDSVAKIGAENVLGTKYINI
jgi:phospholipid/cholesterol/gamma-HCH transport system substrate-binding protein